MKRIFAFLCLCLLLCTAGCSGNSEAHLYAFSFGKADAILLTDGSSSLLIDTGEKDDGEDLVAALKALKIKQIDLLVITHFDKDHVGGASALLDGIPVKRALLPDYEPDHKRARNLKKALDEAAVPYGTVRENTQEAFGEALLSFNVTALPYGPAEGEDADNDQSLILTAEVCGVRLLFMGDAEDLRTKEYLAADAASCDVLKVPHHGQIHETTGALLDAVSPKWAVITDSKKNPADSELLTALSERGITCRRTAAGTVHLVLRDGAVTEE